MTVGSEDSDAVDNEDYSSWTPIVRRRQSAVFLAFLAFIPTMMLADSLGVPIKLSGFSYMALYLFLGWRMDRTECARCGKRVFRRGWYGNAFATKCMNCGLGHWRV